jgi:hypothetical protein
VVGAHTSIEKDSLWHEGHLLDLSIQQEVEVALNQTPVRMHTTQVTVLVHVVALDFVSRGLHLQLLRTTELAESRIIIIGDFRSSRGDLRRLLLR